MPRFTSKAEYYRHHRKVMELALELRVTPKEAEARMKAVEVREQHRAKVARRGRMVSALPPLSLRPDDQQSNDFRRWEASWMARD
jgi:hypothetical protein